MQVQITNQILEKPLRAQLVRPSMPAVLHFTGTCQTYHPPHTHGSDTSMLEKDLEEFFEADDLEESTQLLEDISDAEAQQIFKELGASEKILYMAMEAAQQVLNDNGVKLSVMELYVDGMASLLDEKCRCGSRRVEDGCTPYERCQTSCTGSGTTRTCRRVCVRGCRTRYRTVCNPCPPT